MQASVAVKQSFKQMGRKFHGYHSVLHRFIPAIHASSTNTNTENLLVVGLSWNMVGILGGLIQSLPLSSPDPEDFAPLMQINSAVCCAAAALSPPNITGDSSL